MKLTGYTSPLSGAKGDLLDISGLWSNILGVIVMFVVFATGQKMVQQFGSKIPFVDTQIEPIVTRPSSNTPVRELYGI